MKINQIKITSCEQEAHIFGEITTGNFNYNSSMVINVIDLNRLINLLQKLNPNHEISDMFVAVRYPEGTEYELSAKTLDTKTIYLSVLSDLATARRICA